MKKLLYLMEIDWYWIKQRPQILAELLSEDYEVTVVYLKEIFQKVSLRSDKDELPDSRKVGIIPYRDKNKVAFFLQKWLFARQIRDFEQYDAVWIGNPLLYQYIPKKGTYKLIYDCMDDYAALCGDEKIRKNIIKQEKLLVKKADIIFASSSVLKEKIKQMGPKCEIKLIRNGFKRQDFSQKAKQTQRSRYNIGYIGTVAEWFDFELLKKSVDRFPDIEYSVWGPFSGGQDRSLPENIHKMGVLEHERLWEAAEQTDAMIMPFKVNPIIEAVDPVKLYEYINMGKAVIAPYYKEIERFRPYVYFYRDETSFFQLLKQLKENGFQPSYTEQEKTEFLNANTWQERYQKIKSCLERLDEGKESQ